MARTGRCDLAAGSAREIEPAQLASLLGTMPERARELLEQDLRDNVLTSDRLLGVARELRDPLDELLVGLIAGLVWHGTDSPVP